MCYYNYSPLNVLLSNYPHYNWIIWKFNSIPPGFWVDENNQKLFFDWIGCHKGLFPKGFWKNYKGEYDNTVLNEIGNSLQITNLNEWYRVSKTDLKRAGAAGFVKKRGGLIKLLPQVYPNHNWIAEKFSRKQKKSSQWWLFKTLQEILPGTDIIEEFHLPSMSIIQTGYLMTFDVCIPSLNMVFEYHGIQHYYDHCMFGDVKSRRERDKQRRATCMYHNLTYLEVPYWWQHDKESIVAVIHQARPDAVPHALVTPFQYPIKPEFCKDVVNVIKYSI